MKVTYNWLKTYANFDFSPDELVDKLTMLGLEVDSWNSTTWDFDGVVVGEITKKEAHQHSNKLWVCEVNVGARNLSIVCGAPNVKVGQKVPVAPEGTHLPTGKTIRRSNIRGVESQGMICSEAELGISSRSEGVMVLDTDVEFGKKLSEVLGEGEIVIDIDVTPNRPDCFGVIGIAREIAALAGTSLNKPKINIKNERNQAIRDLIKINILNPEKCPRYTARFIGDVTIKASPWWLVQKLEAVGIRSINNVVDVTNYVMMETGQPLHAFDYDLLNHHEINVKTASDGQLFTTLDEKTHTLNSTCLMICDGEKEVAIGGIMGGLNSEVSRETKNILLESAYFDPVNIRRTAKFLGISTESSRRFERGTDPNGVLYALDRAAQLISEMADGEIAEGSIDAYPSQINSQKIKLRTQRVQALLGIDISSKRINEILASLHFIIKPCNAHEMQVEVPTFRPDIKNETDLIEEVARVYGYENVPADTLAFIEQLTPTNLLETFTRHVQNTLISLRFSQVATYSLLSQPQATLFADDKQTLKLINPISEDLSTLRPSLVPGLLNIIRWNLNRKNKNLKLFEIGNVFYDEKAKVEETTRLTGVLTGNSFVESWKLKSNALDIYDVKGYVAYLLSRNNFNHYGFKPHTCEFTNRKTLSVEIADESVGFMGELKKEVLEKFDITDPVFLFDFNFSKLFNRTNWNRVYSPIPKYPPIKRDIAITINETIDSEKIAEEIKANGGEFLQNLKLFDVFTGKQVGAQTKSIAFNLTFYSLERTLTEDEVDAQINLILDSLAKKYSARLRS